VARVKIKFKQSVQSEWVYPSADDDDFDGRIETGGIDSEPKLPKGTFDLQVTG